jgi:hypothetical protein
MSSKMRFALVVAMVVSLAGAGLVFADRDSDRHERLGAQLTEEQREAVHAKVQEMRESGASREAIHATVREMLTGFGIDVPDSPEAGAVSPPGNNLTDSPNQGTRWGGIKGRF